MAWCLWVFLRGLCVHVHVHGVCVCVWQGAGKWRCQYGEVWGSVGVEVGDGDACGGKEKACGGKECIVGWGEMVKW